MTDWTRKRARQDKANSGAGRPVQGPARCQGRRWDRLHRQTQSADTDGDGCGPGKSPAGSSLGPMAPNKPNLLPRRPENALAARAASAAAPGDKRAKRSQFRPGDNGQAPAGPVVQTDPICRRGRRWVRASKAARAADGTYCAKQSQFPPSGRRDGSGTSHRERNAAIRPRIPATPVPRTGRSADAKSLGGSHSCHCEQPREPAPAQAGGQSGLPNAIHRVWGPYQSDG